MANNQEKFLELIIFNKKNIILDLSCVIWKFCYLCTKSTTWHENSRSNEMICVLQRPRWFADRTV